MVGLFYIYTKTLINQLTNEESLFYERNLLYQCLNQYKHVLSYYSVIIRDETHF